MGIWTDDLDIVWLKELVHQAIVVGKRARSGYKKEAWIETLAKLNAQLNPEQGQVIPFTLQQL
jgi:hypothetical protein